MSKLTQHPEPEPSFVPKKRPIPWFLLHRTFSHWLLVSLILLGPGCRRNSQNEENHEHYLRFVRASAERFRRDDQHPTSLDQWTKQAADLRRNLALALGSPVTPTTPLSSKILGTITRDGYRVERLLLQTMPEIWMTANAYVPAGASQAVPAVVVMTGHWPGARLDPIVQSLCVGLVKLGYFVLTADPFGSGERGIGKSLGEYHGSMTAATLFPSGLTLAGIQVYENRRMVDYLQSRPEIDPHRIAMTGSSGGGAQTMYAGAWDPRLKVTSPVCSVGSYGANLGTCCCLCEIVPGVLQFTEQWGVLGLSAPHPLLVMNAAREDGEQFTFQEANQTVGKVSSIYSHYSSSSSLTNQVFDVEHGYSQSMREQFYGWLALQFGKSSSARPIPEPRLSIDPPETLRCFPKNSRPDDWITIPQYAARQNRQILEKKSWPANAQEWSSQRPALIQNLQTVLATGPNAPQEPQGTTTATPAETGNPVQLGFSPEPGIQLTAAFRKGNSTNRTAIVLSLEGESIASESPLADRLEKEGWNLVTLDLRATGTLGCSWDDFRGAPDHFTAEWGLWIGRPLLGQWTRDVIGLLDALLAFQPNASQDLSVIGLGPAGLVAYAAAALDDRIGTVLTQETLASYVSEVPYKNQRLGTIVPGILPKVGDIPHLIGLIAPRRVMVVKPVWGDGKEVNDAHATKAFSSSSQIWKILNQESLLKVVSNASLEDQVQFLKNHHP